MPRPTAGARAAGLGLPALRPRLARRRRRGAPARRAGGDGRARARSRTAPCVLTTANALLQRMPPAAVIEAQTFRARPGNQIDMKALIGAAGELRLRARADGARRRRIRGARRHPRPLRAGRRRGAPARLLRRHAGDRSAPSTSATQRTTGQRKSLVAAGDERSGADAGDDQPLPPQLHRGVRRAVARRCALRGGQRRPPLRRHGALAAVLLRAARHAVRLPAGRAVSCSTIWRARRWPSGTR